MVELLLKNLKGVNPQRLCLYPISDRDTVDHDDDKLLEELFLSLVHTYTGSDTDTEDEDFLNFMR